VEVELSPAADRVYDLLERLLEDFDIDGEVEVSEDTDSITGEFIGEDLGSIIGARGETIDAIQHLAYRIAFRGSPARKRLVIDAGGYREQRAAALRATADQAAETAVAEQRQVALEAMNALERKVVHEHLKARHDVETYSEGEEPSRHLVIAPLID
jgi:spoIIIJ-associated protein